MEAPHGARVQSRWGLRLGCRPAGVLELRVSDSGYHSRWIDKHAHLVPLVGVQEAGSNYAKPRRFFDFDSAIGHQMRCTGIAFRGDCGLEQLA